LTFRGANDLSFRSTRNTPSDILSYPKNTVGFIRNGGKGLIGRLTIASDTMIQEKMARQMYAKNREKIIQHARNARRGLFIVNFYNNNDVKISSEKDDKAEFSFLIPSALETLDMEFNKALTEYRTYGKKSM
jgi:hypothetical protein